MIKKEMLKIINHLKDRFSSPSMVYYPSVFSKLSENEFKHSEIIKCLDGFVKDGVLIKKHDLMCGYCQTRLTETVCSTNLYCEACDRNLSTEDVYKKTYYKIQKNKKKN